MGTKNNPGVYDCYANADPDEPMFVLLGRDRHAPTLIWLWMGLRLAEGEDAAKISEANDCVEAMLKWQISHGRKPISVEDSALMAIDHVRKSSSLLGGLSEKGKAAMRDIVRDETNFDFSRKLDG